MKIETIAILARMDDGTVRHVYTTKQTRELLLRVINGVEGEVRIQPKI